MERAFTRSCCRAALYMSALLTVAVSAVSAAGGPTIAGPGGPSNGGAPSQNWITWPSYATYYDQGPGTNCGQEWLPTKVGGGFAIAFQTGADLCQAQWYGGDMGCSPNWWANAYISSTPGGDPLPGCIAGGPIIGGYAGEAPGVGYMVDGAYTPAPGTNLKRDDWEKILANAKSQGQCVLPANAQLYFNVQVTTVGGPPPGTTLGPSCRVGVSAGACHFKGVNAAGQDYKAWLQANIKQVDAAAKAQPPLQCTTVE
jgi:hypothetical protein